MNMESRLTKLEAAAAAALDRHQALCEIGRRLGANVAALERLSRDDWWEIAKAIGEGNLAGESVSDEQFAEASEWQLERLAAGGRPSEVFGGLL